MTTTSKSTTKEDFKQQLSAIIHSQIASLALDTKNKKLTASINEAGKLLSKAMAKALKEKKDKPAEKKKQKPVAKVSAKSKTTKETKKQVPASIGKPKAKQAKPMAK